MTLVLVLLHGHRGISADHPSTRLKLDHPRSHYLATAHPAPRADSRLQYLSPQPARHNIDGPTLLRCNEITLSSMMLIRSNIQRKKVANCTPPRTQGSNSSTKTSMPGKPPLTPRTPTGCIKASKPSPRLTSVSDGTSTTRTSCYLYMK